MKLRSQSGEPKGSPLDPQSSKLTMKTPNKVPQTQNIVQQTETVDEEAPKTHREPSSNHLQWSIEAPFIHLRGGDNLEHVISIDFASVRHIGVFQKALRAELANELRKRKRECKILAASPEKATIPNSVKNMLMGFISGPQPTVDVPGATQAALFAYHSWLMTRDFSPDQFSDYPEAHPYGPDVGSTDWLDVTMESYSLGMQLNDTAFTDVAFDTIVNHIVEDFVQKGELRMGTLWQFWDASQPGCLGRKFFIDLFTHTKDLDVLMPETGYEQFPPEFLFDLVIEQSKYVNGNRKLAPNWLAQVSCAYHEHTGTGEKCYEGVQAMGGAEPLTPKTHQTALANPVEMEGVVATEVLSVIGESCGIDDMDVDTGTVENTLERKANNQTPQRATPKKHVRFSDILESVRVFWKAEPTSAYESSSDHSSTTSEEE